MVSVTPLRDRRDLPPSHDDYSKVLKIGGSYTRLVRFQLRKVTWAYVTALFSPISATKGHLLLNGHLLGRAANLYLNFKNAPNLMKFCFLMR